MLRKYPVDLQVVDEFWTVSYRLTNPLESALAAYYTCHRQIGERAKSHCKRRARHIDRNEEGRRTMAAINLLQSTAKALVNLFSAENDAPVMGVSNGAYLGHDARVARQASNAYGRLAG